MDDFFDAEPETQGGDTIPATNAAQQEEYGFNDDSDDGVKPGNDNDYEPMGNNDIGNDDLLNANQSSDKKDSDYVAEVKDEKQDEEPSEQEAKEAEATFLSVWQQQRRVELDKRRQQEQEALTELRQKGQKETENFHAERAKKIKAREDENRNKEKGIREDLQSVFQHGTIWEQVGRMVDLKDIKEKAGGTERMRTLLIYLKNQKK